MPRCAGSTRSIYNRHWKPSILAAGEGSCLFNLFTFWSKMGAWATGYDGCAVSGTVFDEFIASRRTAYVRARLQHVDYARGVNFGIRNHPTISFVSREISPLGDCGRSNELYTVRVARNRACELLEHAPDMLTSMRIVARVQNGRDIFTYPGGCLRSISPCDFVSAPATVSTAPFFMA